MTTETYHKTKAGNYFISNYPPYSFWKPEYVCDAAKALDTNPNPSNPLGMYVHIPFCRKRCHFCYFRVYTGVKSDAVKNYIDALIRELTLYQVKKCIGDREPQFIYFGGGTPSFLSTSQLTHLFGEMKAMFPWDNTEEVTFECEPGTLTEKKVKFLKESGVTRLSLGIENLDDELLSINGRSHTTKEIYRAYEWAKDAEFPQINIDLIAGMLNETESNWQVNIGKIIKMAPDSITIYQMEIPYNTTIYKRMEDAGDNVAPVADWETKRRWVDYAFNTLADAGYTVNSAYTVVKDSVKTKFVYRDKLWQGADLVSTGVASFSHVNGAHYQNEHNLVQYQTRLKKNELPIFRALTPTPDELLVREFLLQFKLGSVSPRYFNKKYHVDVRSYFLEPLEKIANLGVLEDLDDELRLTRSGLLQVDQLLHEFFLPQHRVDRIV